MVGRRRGPRRQAGARKLPPMRGAGGARLFEEALVWCHRGHARVTWTATRGCHTVGCHVEVPRAAGAPPAVGDGRSFVEAYLACRRALDRAP